MVSDKVTSAINSFCFEEKKTNKQLLIAPRSLLLIHGTIAVGFFMLVRLENIPHSKFQLQPLIVKTVARVLEFLLSSYRPLTIFWEVDKNNSTRVETYRKSLKGTPDGNGSG